MKRLVLAAAVLAAAIPAQALAWGNTGHRIIGQAAVRALPSELPAFLRTARAALDVGELSREPDRSKGAGRLHDNDRSPAHFVDLGDDGKIFGGPSIAALPPTREDYDTALRAVGQDSWKAGYLPYAIIDRWQQLAADFAYWRALDYAARSPKWKTNRAWFEADRARREQLILRDLGELSHFVADGSQPLHVTIHFNGWGDFPNPKGYSQARTVHEAFEGVMVNTSVKPEEVAKAMTPLRLCNCAIEQRMAQYLAANGKLVEAVYELEKAGGLAPGDPRGPAFATKQLGVGASELRDVVVEAWRASLEMKVGWRPVALKDILAGEIDPYPPLYSKID
jgi:hypothetical protein